MKTEIIIKVALLAAILLMVPLFALAHAESNAEDATVIPGVRLAGEDHTVYVPVRKAGQALGWPVYWDSNTETLYLNNIKVVRGEHHTLPDGTQVMPVRLFRQWGARVQWDNLRKVAVIADNGKSISIPAAHVWILDGVTFAAHPDTLYAPIRMLGRALATPVDFDSEANTVYWDGNPVSRSTLRLLPGGRHLIALTGLAGPEGVTVTWQGDHQAARVRTEGRIAWVRRGNKRVAVSIDRQRMRAWQGGLLVLDTRVSTGRPGKPTPTGSFTAGPLKRPLLISHKYGNARMPWSVQVQGDVVIHGFPSVPPHAASHGCVRVPLTGTNPAHWFYRWVEVGTPIEIEDGWPADNPTV